MGVNGDSGDSRQAAVSVVGLLQAFGVVAWALAGALAATFGRGDQFGWTVAVVMSPALLPGGVIALELMCAAMVSGRGPAGCHVGLRGWCRTWWVEWWLNLSVFGWQQPFGWKRLPDALQTSSDRSPLVFVHGYLCNRGFWHPWLRRCRAEGLPYVTVNLEPPFAGIDAYVDAIDAAVQEAERTTGRRPVLIGHSMGGLAIRAWLATQGGSNDPRVLGVVTIGAPHAGTWLARWSRTTNGKQMRRGSDWLWHLCQRETQRSAAGGRENYLCWASATDNVVFPVNTAFLTQADNRLVNVAGHIEQAYLPQVISTSLAWIASAERSPATRTAS